MLSGVAKYKGEVLFDLSHATEPGAKVSDSIAAMKGKVMAGVNAYIAAHNLRSDDVDVMEEDPNADEEASGKPRKARGRGGGGGGGGSHSGQKRKHP